MTSSRFRRAKVAAYCASWGVALAALAFTVVRGIASTASPFKPHGSQPVGFAEDESVKTDPAKVVGPKKCTECHKNEHARWMKTVHHGNHKRLTSPKGKTYAKAAGGNAVCINCHATPQKTDAGVAPIAGLGVSCESCHGGASGWLKEHGDFGGKDVTRDMEKPMHRKDRLELCEKAGKVGPRDLYGVAKKCYSCHIVGNAKLVNAGHSLGHVTFEFASWTNGEVRHNFQVNKNKNAEVSSIWLNPVGANAGEERKAQHRKRKMYVLGVLVDLETSLRLRGGTKNAALARKLAGRILGINRKLLQINAVAATEETKSVGAMVPTLLARLFVPKPDDAKFYGGKADQVAKAAKEFLAKHDGSKLKALDAKIPKPHFSKDYKP